MDLLHPFSFDKLNDFNEFQKRLLHQSGDSYFPVYLVGFDSGIPWYIDQFNLFYAGHPKMQPLVAQIT